MLPEQALPLGTALDTFLQDGAWVGRFEGESGRLGPGLRGDVVVLDRDISSGDGLAAARVVHTFVGGRRV